MLKKQYRVKDTREFKTILDYRKAFHNKYFSIYTKPKKEKYPRIGISVSKKIGKAHVRNKIKRQIRSIAYHLYTFDENFDIIIIVKPLYLTQDYSSNAKAMQSLYKMIKEKYNDNTKKT